MAEHIDDVVHDIRSHLLVLQQSLASLWSNYLANGVPDPSATSKRLRKEGADSLAAMVDRTNPEGADKIAATVDLMLGHFDGLWRAVDSMLAEREQQRLR